MANATEFNASEAKRVKDRAVSRAIKAFDVLTQKVIRPYELHDLRSDEDLSRMKQGIRNEVNWVIDELRALVRELD